MKTDIANSAPDNPLNYETPRFSIAPFNLRFAAYPLLVAALLSLTNARIIPGGPYISLHANIIPAAITLFSACVASFHLRSPNSRTRTKARLLLICCLGLDALIACDIYLFTIQPYARGSLIGI